MAGKQKRDFVRLDVLLPVSFSLLDDPAQLGAYRLLRKHRSVKYDSYAL